MSLKRSLAALVVAAALSSASQSATISTIHQVYKHEYDLPSLPTIATAKLEIVPTAGGVPVVWNVDNLRRSDVGYTYTITPTSASELWPTISSYLLGPSSLITESVTAGPLVAKSSWTFPNPNLSPIYGLRSGVQSISFSLDLFLSDIYQGKNEGAVQGTFETQYAITVPEPAAIGLLLVALILAALKRR